MGTYQDLAFSAATKQLVDDAWAVVGLIEAATDKLPEHPEEAASILSAYLQGGWPESVAANASTPAAGRLSLVKKRGYQVATVLAESGGDPDKERFQLKLDPDEWSRQRARDRSAG